MVCGCVFSVLIAISKHHGFNWWMRVEAQWHEIEYLDSKIGHSPVVGMEVKENITLAMMHSCTCMYV